MSLSLQNTQKKSNFFISLRALQPIPENSILRLTMQQEDEADIETEADFPEDTTEHTNDRQTTKRKEDGINDMGQEDEEENEEEDFLYHLPSEAYVFVSNAVLHKHVTTKLNKPRMGPEPSPWSDDDEDEKEKNSFRRLDDDPHIYFGSRVEFIPTWF